MRLVSIKVKNFRVLKRLSISFPDAVIGVIGPNGAGKSSLVEAIAWALYGNQAARSGKAEIKSIFAGRYDDCEVSLRFTINEEKYHVIRRLVGSSERPEVELYRGEASESVGVNETKRYVGELLGLDWKGFLTSFLARQQELNALSDLQPSKRRDHLAGMLGIERLDRAIQNVKEDSRANQRQVGFLERQLVETEQIELRIKELIERISQLSQQANRLDTARKTAEAAFTEVQAKFLKVQQAKSDWLQFQARLEAEEKTKANLSQQLQGFKQEASKLADYQQELAQLENKLADLTSLKQRLEVMKQAKGRLEMRSELAKQMTELSNEKRQIDECLVADEKLLTEYSRQLGKIPENIRDLLLDNQRRLEQARNEYSRLSSEKRSMKRDIDKLRKQMADIAQLGPDSVCDRCLRPLGNDLPEIKAHLSNELSQLDAQVQELNSRLRVKEEEGTKLKASAQELEKKANARYELSIKNEACLNEQKSHMERKESLLSKLTRASQQHDQLKQIEFDEAQFSAMASKVAQLEHDQSRFDQLKGSLSRLPAVSQAIEEYTGKVAATNKEVTRLESELERLAYSEKEFEEVKKSFEEAQRQFETAKNEYLAASKEVELNQKELEGKQEQMKRFQQTAQELEDCRTNQYYGEKLANLFAQFRTELIAGIRPTLTEISSRLISDMTNGKYSLVELDEKYNLRVMDYGQYFGVERFSGGEKDLANLCLRLAISLALTESAGLDRSFVILDEVFGSQDDERKELIVKALANLKARFPQILLITHVEDLKDRVEQLIEVLPTGAGWSEIRVNGNAT